MLYIARLATICARGRKRGASAASSAYRLAAVMVSPVDAAVVPVAPVSTPYGFGGVPLPLANDDASSSSLASENSRLRVASMPPQSCCASTEKGTNACTFEHTIAG